MPRVVQEISIRRPIEDVFAVLTDVEQTARWFAGDVEDRWTSPPPHGVGSTRHQVIRMGGQTIENDAVAIEYDPPHRAVMRGTSPSAPSTVALDLTPDANGTRVVVTSDVELRGVAQLFSGLVVSGYRRAWSEGLSNLKRLMESGEL